MDSIELLLLPFYFTLKFSYGVESLITAIIVKKNS